MRVKLTTIMANKSKRVSKKPAKRRDSHSLRGLRCINPQTVAAEQGVQPLQNPQNWYADFWPEDETADQFNEAVRRWRQEGKRHHV